METVKEFGVLESAQRQLDALRGAIDARLEELESVLDDPARAGSLADLILELSRLATTEAQAAAVRACLLMRHDADAALLEADARSSVAVAAERKTSSELRKALDTAQMRADVSETEKHAALQSAHDERQRLEGERSARSELDRTIARLERQIKDANAELEGARESFRRVAGENAHARGRTAELEQELLAEQDRHGARQRELASELADALRRAVDAEQQVATGRDASRSFDEERARSSEKLAELNVELADVRQRLDASQAALLTTSDARALAQHRAAEFEQTVARLTDSIQKAQNRADEATRALDQERSTSASLRSAFAAAETERAAAETTHAAAQADHHTLADELERERQHLAELRTSTQELQRAHDALHGELQAERAAAAEMRGSAAGSSEERTAQMRELERICAAKAALDAALAEARAEVGSLRADLAALQHRLAAVETGRAGAEDAATEFEVRVSTIERERDALSLALDTERMTSADLRAAVGDAERQVTDSNSALDDLRQQLAQSVQEAAAVRAPVNAQEVQGEVTQRKPGDSLADRLGDGAITLEDEGWESIRLSTRYRFTSRIDLKVNGTPGVLEDLSVGGCGLRTVATLEVNDRVRVELPGDPIPLLCVGQVVWVRRELAVGRAPARCHAGIQFTQASEAAIEAFIIICADV